jgi:Putative peptidoglycan-binding domain-containing protein
VLDDHVKQSSFLRIETFSVSSSLYVEQSKYCETKGETQMPITDLIPIPQNINNGVNAARQITMKSLLGVPRGNFTRQCQPVTNPVLKGLIKTDDVGPFRVTGLAPAVESLKEVLAEVRSEQAEVFAGLGTAGMLCARLVTGSAASISNHSWGTAIDLTLNGLLDQRGDRARTTQRGLSLIAPIFNRHRWYWGAGFPVEDSMHFELSDQKIRELHAAGVFKGAVETLPEPALSIGDRGQQVKRLQEALNAQGETLVTDGIFGASTHAAVISFQARHGLTPDGIVGSRTRAALGL